MKGEFKGGILFFHDHCGQLPPDTYPHKQERIRNQERVSIEQGGAGASQAQKYPFSTYF